MKLPKLSQLYLGLSLFGLVGTWYYNIRHFQAGRSLSDFIKDGYVNDASSSLTSDISVVSIVFNVWMFVEAKRLGIRWPLLYAFLCYGVALAFSFPLFLAVREYTLEKIRLEGGER